MSYFTKRYHSPGTPPGTLVETPAGAEGPIHIRLIDYTAGDLTVKEDVEADTCRPYIEQDSVTWVHVQGQVQADVMRSLGKAFHLHPLAMEDVLNSGQRPKMDSFDEQLFIVMSLPLMEGETITVRQVSLFVNKRFIVSFCDGPEDPFTPLIKRARDQATRLRNNGMDYLLYAMLDLVVDQGFPVLETFGLQLEDLEEELLEIADRQTLGRIHLIKRELILLRRMLWPQREVISQILRDENHHISEGTRIYLRDCYDHTIQIMDLLETYRDMTTSMLDIYLSSASNRLNETMRVLTVISTVFIPLTFITGLYGMNFVNDKSPWAMPELHWYYGYPLALLVMFLCAAAMLAFFKRKGWL
ncbi:MAG TPA: magnesium/cobalt transporter CorA [Mariprofundaceae bacterium]|nr:magnesium/cobalt transporter CorA [Mariprofundaceae bacterium]